MAEWYKKAYRRHLLDMHIEDWDDRFLSEFDPEDYVDNLKRAKIQCAMIYLQSHVGLCNFPTKVAATHKAFVGNDKMKRLLTLCKQNKIAVVGYYSLIHNNWAEINHPEWRMIEENGKTARENGGRYGFVCPNNYDYRNFVVEQIKEMHEFFPLDGVFYDMPFWPVRCHCHACRKRWSEEVGTEFPSGELSVGRRNEYAKKLQEWMANFCKFVADKTREIMPDVTIEFNNAGVVAFDWTSGETEAISDLADYAGGDLYGDLYAHSFSAKYFRAVSQNQPFEYMNSRCVKLYEHTATKSEEELRTEISLTRAHHGASFIIDAIDPVGTMDKRVYDLLGKLFDEQSPLDEYNNGELLADVAVFFDSKTMFDGDGYNFGNKQAAIAAVKRLIQHHIPVAVVANGHLGDLHKYKCVVAPCVAPFDNPTVDEFVKYVQNGGKLYIDGACDERLLSLVGKQDGYVGSKITYLAPKSKYRQLLCDFSDKYPLPMGYKLPVVKPWDNVEIMATITLPYTDPEDNFRFAAIHSNPPGIATDYPALLRRKVGAGEVIWCAGAAELDDRQVVNEMFVNLVKALANDDFSVSAKCSANLEIISFRNDGDFYVNAVSLSGDGDCIYPVEITLKIEGTVASVTELHGGEDIRFVQNDNKLTFNDTVTVFRAYKVRVNK